MVKDNTLLKLNLGLKVASRSKKPTSTIKIVKRDVNAICILVKDEYKAKIADNSSISYLSFTDDSKDLRKYPIVFSIDGKIKYDRTNQSYRIHPGLDTQYTTLCNNYDCIGDIVQIDKRLLFRLKEMIKIHKDNGTN